MAGITLKKLRGNAVEITPDLMVADREFVVLTGPGSSGILAIVRMIAGLEDISEGEILFDNRRIDDLAPRDRDVALVAHDYAPYPGLTVFENLAMGLRRKNFADREIGKRIASVAAALGIEAQLETNAETLSTEQQRFAGLARAMVRQPKVYLFDEPFADLEPAAASRGRAAIAALRLRASSTILYATSDPVEALAFSARTVIFEDGVARQDADAQAIFDEP